MPAKHIKLHIYLLNDINIVKGAVAKYIAIAPNLREYTFWQNIAHALSLLHMYHITLYSAYLRKYHVFDEILSDCISADFSSFEILPNKSTFFK